MSNVRTSQFFSNHHPSGFTPVIMAVVPNTAHEIHLLDMCVERYMVNFLEHQEMPRYHQTKVLLQWIRIPKSINYKGSQKLLEWHQSRQVMQQEYFLMALEHLIGSGIRSFSSNLRRYSLRGIRKSLSSSPFSLF